MGGGLQHFSVSPRPLSFGFGAMGLGPGLDNLLRGLRNDIRHITLSQRLELRKNYILVVLQSFTLLDFNKLRPFKISLILNTVQCWIVMDYRLQHFSHSLISKQLCQN